MSIVGNWYQSEHSPQDATGLVGGAADTGAPLVGALSELFEPGHSPFLGRPSYERFRKVFFKNEGALGVSDAVAFWADLEHAEQMKFAFAKSASDTTTNSTTMPAGYLTGDFYGNIGLLNGVDVPTSPIETGDSAGFWIWQRIAPGLTPETGTLARLSVAGNVT